MAIEKKEAYPLEWPADWPRTRPQDRRTMTSWKLTGNKYRDAIGLELQRMKAPGYVVSCNVPLTLRNELQKGMDPVDVGVAVYFSRPRAEDYGWQDALNLHQPAPTENEISDAFRSIATKYHPDRGGDAKVFAQYVAHRDNALAYVRRTTGKSFDYVIACDAFKEVRWNLCAIAQTLKAIRAIERAGTSTLMERAFKGFTALTAGQAVNQ